MAIELGENLAKYAKNRFSSYDNFQIVNADFEKIIFFYDLYMQEFNYYNEFYINHSSQVIRKRYWCYGYFIAFRKVKTICENVKKRGV